MSIARPASRARAVASAVAAAAVLAALGCVTTLRWHRAELGARSAPAEPPPLAPAEFRAVTLNAFRLSQPHRVPALIGALETSASLLGRRDGAPLPELIAIQEIESRAAGRALQDGLSATHRVAICECAVGDGGSLRSAVALAASREFFAWRSHRCLPLGREWPDHPRCAVRAELAHGDRPVRAAAVHLAWHFDNAPMAARLRARLGADPSTVLLGDFNTWSGTPSHRTLSSAPLRDPFPGAPPTHFTGARLDYVFVGRALSALRGLGVHRGALFDALAPTDALTLPDACATEGPPACPLSDHLPEGAAIALR